MSNAPPDAALQDPRLKLIFDSYQRLTGKRLLDSAPFDPEVMWHALHAIVAHGTEVDPVFFYGNRTALQRFEMTFDDFVRLPSRLSAEPLAQEARTKLLERVTKHSFIDDYSGMRISSSNRRFMIANATVWNLLDAAGVYHGQAATFIA